jgi:hypothetical protein
MMIDYIKTVNKMGVSHNKPGDQCKYVPRNKKGRPVVIGLVLVRAHRASRSLRAWKRQCPKKL